MSEEKDNKTNFKEVEIVAELVKEEVKEEFEATPKVSEEKLRKAQLLDDLHEESSVTRELPKRKPATAKIPDKGELGKKFTVKLGKVYDHVTLKVYQGEELIETGRKDLNIVHEKKHKKTDEVSYDFYDPVPLKGKTFNGLTKGKYLVIVHASGQEAGDEFEQRQVVDVE